MGSKRIQYSVAELHRLWASGASYTEIAAALGCAESYVQKLKSRHKLPHKPREYAAPTGDPTPDEIDRLKAEIKARHMQAMLRESEDQTRSRVWQENKRLGIQEAI